MGTYRKRVGVVALTSLCGVALVVWSVDSKTHAIKTRVPMPNGGDSHGGIFVSYSRGPSGLVAEVVSDQNGLHGSALAAAMKAIPAASPAAE